MDFQEFLFEKFTDEKKSDRVNPTHAKNNLAYFCFIFNP